MIIAIGKQLAIFVLTQAILNVIVHVKCHSHSSHPLLLLISFDGFRYDYIDTYDLTTFASMREKGSWAHHLDNVFPTLTFPNHWSLVTGLYDETHGITDNHIYDPKLRKEFNYKLPESHTYEWYGQNRLVEPIWTTNQRAGKGRKSAAEWPGSNVIFNNENVLNIFANGSTPYVELIDSFIELFVDEKEPINFGAVYFDEPGKLLCYLAFTIVITYKSRNNRLFLINSYLN
jgi:predicted AlkP superfamily pyrophosphatase or phosphodiesterase